MKKSTQVAVGGLASALCLLLMFLTGMIPFTTYALPAMAGIVLIAVVIENGTQTAALVYVSVSLLSLFLSPDKEAALMFLCFFGYYPVIKAKLEQIRPKLLELLAKYGILGDYLCFGPAGHPGGAGRTWQVLHRHPFGDGQPGLLPLRPGADQFGHLLCPLVPGQGSAEDLTFLSRPSLHCCGGFFAVTAKGHHLSCRYGEPDTPFQRKKKASTTVDAFFP